MRAAARPGQRLRLRPASFGMRLALALFAIAVLGHLVFWAAQLGGKRSEVAERIGAATVAQMAAITELLARTPPERRDLVLRAVQTPLLRVRTSGEAPFADAADEWPLQRMKTWLPGELAASFGTRPLRLRALPPWRLPEADDAAGRAAAYPGPVVEIAVAEPALGWVVFSVAVELIEVRHRPRFLVLLVAGALLVAAIAAVAGRRMAAPLRRLAAAAERLGSDLSAPPLPETGSRELRQASRAFNEMQARLKRYFEDRMRMLAAVSHDLRTALTRLRLRVEFIDDPAQRARAEADLAAMQSILESTLAYARAEAEGERMVKVDLMALVETACDDLRDAGHAVGFTPGPRTVLTCRPVALRRALDNLLVNAVRYGGGAEVEIRAAADMVEIAIGDRGPGIPPDERENVFEPFYRLEGSRSAETGGVGLGLAVARSIARDHGGDIRLEDRSGGGLLARLVLPAGGPSCRKTPVS